MVSRMKKLFLAAMAAAALGSAFAAEPCWPATKAKPLEAEVVFSTSGGSLVDVLRDVYWKDFEAQCGVKVVSYATPGRTFSQSVALIQSGNVPFDIFNTLTPQEYPLAVQAGILQRLPDGAWNGLSDKMSPGSFSEYGVWGSPYSTVMVYSKKHFPDGLKTWADFWDVKKYPGARILQNDPITIVFALMSLGMTPKDIYPITDDKMAKAFARLNEIRPQLRNFWKAGDQPIQGVGTGEFVAGSAWSGRAVVGQKQGLPLGINWTGNVLNVSWYMIPKGAKNPNAAAALLRFMQDTGRQAEFAKRMNYAGTRARDLAPLISAEIFENLPTNPKNLETASEVDAKWWAENEQRMGEIWTKWVTTGQYR